jgi:hypothetical protein
MDIILLALIGIVLYLIGSSLMGAGGANKSPLSSPAITPASGASSAPPAQSAAAKTAAQKLTERQAQDALMVNAVNAGNVVLNAKGLVVADAVYKGLPRVTQQAMVYNIQKTEGINTPITTNVGGDPLLISVDKSVQVTGKLPAGVTVSTQSQSHLVGRAPTSDAEHLAARVANAAQVYAQGGYTKQQYEESLSKMGVGA